MDKIRTSVWAKSNQLLPLFKRLETEIVLQPQSLFLKHPYDSPNSYRTVPVRAPVQRSALRRINQPRFQTRYFIACRLPSAELLLTVTLPEAMRPPFAEDIRANTVWAAWLV
jgi:hypothetical protein